MNEKFGQSLDNYAFNIIDHKDEENILIYESGYCSLKEYSSFLHRKSNGKYTGENLVSIF